MPVRETLKPLKPLKSKRAKAMSKDKPVKNVRDKYLQIRLTADEAEQIKVRAGTLGTSTFLRQLALSQKIEVPKAKARKIIHAADPELVRHVAWIGNNMNQIAKHLNSGNAVDNEVLVELVTMQATLESEIERILSHDR